MLTFFVDSFYTSCFKKRAKRSVRKSDFYYYEPLPHA